MPAPTARRGERGWPHRAATRPRGPADGRELTMKLAAFLAAPLSLALSLALARPPGELKTIPLNGRDCGPEGTAKSEGGKALNRLKNRYTVPAEADIDPEVSLVAMLAPGYDDERFDPKKAA